MKILHLNNYADGSGADLAFRATVVALQDYSLQKNALQKNAQYINLSITTTDSQSDAPILENCQTKAGLGKLSYIYSSLNRDKLSAYLNEQKPDILHAHGFYAAISPSILTAIKHAKESWGMRFIQTAHSHELICANATAFDYRENRICTDCKGNKTKLKIFYRNCDRRGWLHSWVKGIRCFTAHNMLNQVTLSDHIICPSNLMKNNLIDEGISQQKLSLIRNIVQKDIPTRNSENHNRRKELIYFGRLSKEKNLNMLVRSFAKFRESNTGWRLVLIGEGEEIEAIKSEAKRQSCAEYIEFVPFLAQPDLFKRISQGRIMVMTSEVLENAPLVIPEAILNGLYPVVPNHGGMKESIDWLELGSSYTSGDQDALTSALLNAAKLKIDFSLAQGKISEELSANAYCKKVTSLYLELLAQ